MTLNFKINSEAFCVDLSTLPPDITLNTFIREQAQLTATKFMCLEGGCGACIVAVRRKHPRTGLTETFSVNSCLTLLNLCRDWEVITDEGLGSKRKGYHPIQKQLAALNGTQCGFCSPGFVATMFAMLESKKGKVSMDEVENSFGGNLCRCTGYRPILDAMKSFANDSSFVMLPELQDIEDLSLKLCNKLTDNGLDDELTKQENVSIKLTYDDTIHWYWPKTLQALLQVLEEVPITEEFMLVAGNTAHGVYRRSDNMQHFIDINNIAVLKDYSADGEILTLGANLSLTESMKILKQASNTTGFKYCQSVYRHFDLIANSPVRNVGTLAGNISLKKTHPGFISDVFVIFECLDVTVVVRPLSEAQKKVSLKEFMNWKDKKFVIIAFEFKSYPEEQYIYNSYKIMPRAQNAHAYVNAAFLLECYPNSDKIKSARICFGGIRPDFVHSKYVESKLTGNVYYDNKMIGELFSELSATLNPDAVLPDASPQYRSLLACALLYRFLLSIAPSDKIKPEFQSGREILKRPLSSGTQEFETVKKNYPITEPVRKLEGLVQCSGEAKYMNDLVTTRETGYCVFVTAKKVGATIEEIDASAALRLKGVLAFFAAKDIPGKNLFFEKSMQLGVEDEELFCSGTVKFYDQPLGVIVATTHDIAQHASSMVRVMYSNRADRAYINIDDVLSCNENERLHLCFKSKSNDEIEFRKDADILSSSGIFKVGSQYPFTMEPQTTIVVPLEDSLEVWCCTQWMDHTQVVIAELLSLKVNQVQLQVRRLGGAFGGKWTRCNQVAGAAALAAYKLNRPIRFVQTIESMMCTLGKRWACRSDYSFDIKKNGKIVKLENTFYEDGGCSLNENPIVDFTIPAMKNCYDISDGIFKYEGHAVLTDAPSATTIRAPGTLEGVAMMENIIEHIAFEAKIDPASARMINLSPNSKMAELLPEFLQSTGYIERRKNIEQFNTKNRWVKRGLGLAVMAFPIIYILPYTATVVIYHFDGTVAISHGGIEMGQGLNTKAAQVAAYELGVPLETIKIEPSQTVNGANSGGTGASIGGDVICFAVRKACKTLNERLKPIKDSLKSDASWKEVIEAAQKKNINLIASENFKEGDLEKYSVFGLGLTEVKVDILTGNLLVTRVDILEDTGESLSPFIDVGQVEGAFVMGLGYWLTEQLIYDRQTGRLITDRTWNYKPPGAKDIPIDFRIKLSQKYPNQGGFMRSKAAGEPPICLSISVIFAIQQAIQSARKDAGLKRQWVRLGAPTTPEVIALNCGTEVNSFLLS